MNHNIRTQLTRVFTDHTALMQAAARKRVSRNEEAKRREVAFCSQFEEHARTVILPLFEEVSVAVHENGHGCTVTCATHGTFFSGADEAPGVIFMFYPGSMPTGDYALKPLSSHVAVFADLFRQKAQLYAKSVRPGGFTPGQLPNLLSLQEVTTDLLAATCISVIKETLHRMEA